MEAHLAECEACRAEAIEVRRLIDAGEAGKPRMWLYWTLPAAAAAAAAGILLLAPGSEPGGREGPVLRTDEAGTVTIEAVSPTGTLASPDSVVFVWRRTGADVTYQITVMDEEGTVLWQGQAGDTTATLPDDVALEPDARYYWYVDGLLELARTATSSVQEFTISR